MGDEDPRLEIARSVGWGIAARFEGHPKAAQFARDCLEEREESLLLTSGAGHERSARIDAALAELFTECGPQLAAEFMHVVRGRTTEHTGYVVDVLRAVIEGCEQWPGGGGFHTEELH